MSLPLRIFFDFSCPYCYIAWCFTKKFKETNALADEWITWEIHPEAPIEGIKIQELVSDIDMVARRQKLNDLGAPVGVFPGNKEHIPNTRFALNIGEFAKEQGQMHEWIDKVYHASFVEDQNIADKQVLLTLAEQMGFDVEKIIAVIEKDQYAKVLLEHDQECSDKKVEFVPSVYKGDKKLLEGVFTYSTFATTMTGHKE